MQVSGKSGPTAPHCRIQNVFSSVSIFLISSCKPSKQSLLTGAIETFQDARQTSICYFNSEMRCTKLLSVVPSGAKLALKRYLGTDAKPPKSSPSERQVPQPASGRFLPARPGVKVAIRNPPPPHRTLPSEKTPGKEPQASQAAIENVYSTAELIHILDVSLRSAEKKYWRFIFPRGVCPGYAWWDSYKPAGTKASELRWTSGQMDPLFWKRSGAAVALSGTLSSLLGGAGVLLGVSHIDGLVPTSTRLSIFAAVALPSFAYGIFRSRIFQEAWMGLIGSYGAGKGTSMMPSIHPDSTWQYKWKFRPMRVKAGDVVSVRSVISNSVCDSAATLTSCERKPYYLLGKGSGLWLGKRVIAVEGDVIKMEELGE